MKSLVRLVQRSKRIVALTGAGISVESGITPFRTAHGGEAIWAEFDASKMTQAAFNCDPETQAAWWALKRKLQAELAAAEPNPAHNFFGLLERQGKLAHLITQNIDSLHQKGGVSDSKMIELHGHMRGVICSDRRSLLNPEPYGEGLCDYTCALDAVDPTAVPSCPKCRAPLRTETVMFQQAMPSGAVERAREVLKTADLLIVVGSTLLVAPANELPAEALRRKVPVAMVNLDDTRYDEHVHVLLRQPAGEVFQEVVEMLDSWVEDEVEEQEPEVAKADEIPETVESDSDFQLYGDDDLGM